MRPIKIRDNEDSSGSVNSILSRITMRPGQVGYIGGFGSNISILHM